MPTLDPVGPQVPPVDYGDKLAAAKRSLFTPPRWSLFTPPLTAAGHMKNLAERLAELRNAIMRLPGNPSCGDRAGLRHRLLHLENTLMSARGSLDDVIIAIADGNDAAL